MVLLPVIFLTNIFDIQFPVNEQMPQLVCVQVLTFSPSAEDISGNATSTLCLHKDRQVLYIFLDRILN
jgi:hypothetical protein